MFLSVDSRRIPYNPLYKAFKAKSFTAKDITLHFYILDILAEGESMTVRQIVDAITNKYLSPFKDPLLMDESTVRKKLKEYEMLGLLTAEKRGRTVFYKRTDNPKFDFNTWIDAISFFSEVSPLGVIGSFLLEKFDMHHDVFRYKHHYILHALDSEILCSLLCAIDEQRRVELTLKSLHNNNNYIRGICPLKVYCSTQTGRQYILGYNYREYNMVFYRMDAIKHVKIGEIEKEYSIYERYQELFSEHLWGVSAGRNRKLEHIEMTITFQKGEDFIIQRLKREKRHGHVEIIDENTCKFKADVYDAMEMLPWIRTFIGRIQNLQCSNKFVLNTYQEDLKHMGQLYGGDSHAVQ